MFALKRSEAEINRQLNRAVWALDHGSKVPAASYEEGVIDTIQRLVG